jgi:hypothetical protein
MGNYDVNRLKKVAVNCLITEVFSYMDGQRDEQYIAIARKNSQLHNQPSIYFSFKGVMYPDPSSSLNIMGQSLPLHPSLFAEHLNVCDQKNDWVRINITNYLTAIVNASHNKIVLNQLLPDVLISTLQQKFTPVEYSIIDAGSPHGRISIQPVKDTKVRVEDIKIHYRSAITELKKVLMDKFLLQGR